MAGASAGPGAGNRACLRNSPRKRVPARQRVPARRASAQSALHTRAYTASLGGVSAKTPALPPPGLLAVGVALLALCNQDVRPQQGDSRVERNKVCSRQYEVNGPLGGVAKQDPDEAKAPPWRRGDCLLCLGHSRRGLLVE